MQPPPGRDQVVVRDREHVRAWRRVVRHHCAAGCRGLGRHPASRQERGRAPPELRDGAFVLRSRGEPRSAPRGNGRRQPRPGRAALPRHDAVVSVHQNRRLTYAQFAAETDRLAKAFLAAGVEHGERVGIWSPNSLEWVLVQYATAKIGAILVNVNPAYRLSELEYALRQSGVSTLIVLDRYKTSEYLAMVREVRGSLPGAARGRDHRRHRAGRGRDGLGRLRRVRRRGRRRRARRAQGALPVRRADQHPVHLGNDRLSERRDALAPQHPQQRLLHRRRLPLHRSRPRLHPGAVLPLLRNGARQPRVHDARRGDRHPELDLRSAS